MIGTRQSLFNKYRPRDWNEVVGHEKVVRRLLALRDRGGFGGRAFWLSGPSGVGKTTLAYLIATEVADPAFVRELDASELTPASLRNLEAEMCLYGAGRRNGRAYIINEAHGLRKDAIRQLLVLLERLPSHVVVIFTTTKEGQESLFEEQIDASPLLSRCLACNLSAYGVAEGFARRAKEIAAAEGLDGRPLGDYLKLVRKHKNNMRAVLQAIEAGEMME